MKRETMARLDERIVTFLIERGSEKQLREDLNNILQDACDRGLLDSRMKADVVIEGDELKVTYRRPAIVEATYDLNCDYSVVRPASEEWDDSVLTCVPVPRDKFDAVMDKAFKKFCEKIESRPGYPLYTEDTDAWVERVEQEVLAELNASGELPFEMEAKGGIGWFPKNPWKEIDGCVVVKI